MTKQVEIYDDPNRYAEPGKIELGDVISFYGYQKFYLSDTFIEINPVDKGLVNKKNLTKIIFYSNWIQNKTVLDLGANSAYFCFHSLFRGAKKTTAVEMDPTYVNMLKSAKDFLNIQNFEIVDKNIVEIEEKADLVLAFALIHWIYSCTSDYGSLSQAIKKLADLTNDVLVIEWIDPNDEAIKFFKHTEWNKDIITEEYSKENFEKALSEIFESFEYVGDIKETRQLYFAFKKKETKNEIEKSYTGLPLQDILAELSENGYPFVVLKNEEIILNSLDKFNDLTIDVLTSEQGKAFLKNLLDEISLKNQNGFLVYQFFIGEHNGHKLYINLKIISDKEEYFNNEVASLFLKNRIKLESIFVLNNDHKILYLLYNIVYYFAAGENTYIKTIKELNGRSKLNLDTKKLNNIGYLFNFLNENNIYKIEENTHITNYSFKYINPIQTVVQSRILCWYQGTFYISRIYKYLKDGEIIIQKQANRNIIKNEFEILNKLNSDYFPKVYELNEVNNFATFKMEYIEGQTLSELKSLKNVLNLNEIKEFILECFNLLSDLKYNNITHRDISPSNIILRNKKPVLIDFGWAESNEIKSIDAPGLGGNYKPKNGLFSDLYSLGIMLEELISEVEEFSELIEFMTNENNQDNLENIKIGKEILNKIKIENPLNKAITKIEEGKKLLLENNVESAYQYFIGAKQLISNKQASEIGLFYLLSYCQFNLGDFEKASENITTEMILNPDNLAAFELDEKINNELNKSSQTENIIEKDWEYPVSIIIPIYNRPGLTEQCIMSIYENTKSDFELIIVDNNSDDETKLVLNNLQNKYNFTLITNSINEGFAIANNKAIEVRKGENVFLLNNDTVVTANWLESSLELIQKESAGIVGSCLLYPDSDIIQHKGVLIGTEDGNTLAPYHIKQYHKLSKVDNKTQKFSAVTGAAMLISSDLIAAIGGLDDKYINGLEDIDYCFKATSVGAKIWYNADSIIYHYESMSKDRHKHDIANWQRLNQKWLGKIKFDETQEQTIKNVQDNNLAKNKLNEEIIKESINYEDNFISRDIKEDLTNPYENIDYSIIIPVHNNLQFTKKCIENIYKTSAMYSIEVIIIDNASTDETIDYLNSIKDLVTVIKNDKNESFSRANNQGAEIAKGNYLVFLNNDVEVQPGWLESLDERFREDNKVVVQGGKLVYPNGLIQHCGVVWGPVSENFNLHYHIYLAANPDVEWVNKYREFQMVTGALFAIRSKVFNEIGKFDEGYFFGHEDLDLCLKSRSAGYKVMYNPEVVGIHHESVTKKSEGIKKFERFITEPDSYDAKNHKYFLSKWENIIEVDAQKYYLEDGLYGLAGLPDRFENFQAKLKELFEALKLVPEELYQRKAKRVSEILFNNPSYDFVANVQILLNTSYERLIQAVDFVKDGSFEDNSNKRLKVLMTMYGWNESGGGTIFPRDVAIEYVKQGYDVFVFYAGADDIGINEKNFIKEWVDEKVKLCGVYNREITFTNSKNPKYEINDPELSAIFETKLDEFKPDIVHFHNFVGLSFNIAKIAKQKGYKTLYTPFNYHLIDPDLYMINSDLKKWESPDLLEHSNVLKMMPELKNEYIERIEAAKLVLNNYIDMTLAVSTRVKDILVEFGCRPEKITIINQVPKSVNKLKKLDKNRKIKKPIKIGYIGGVMTHKGVHNLIVASSILPKNSAELNIYGFVDNKYKEILLSIQTNIKVNLKGAYQFNQLNEIAKDIDIAVLPSMWEDCAPFATLECLAMGIPVVAPNIGGFSDFIVDDFNGKIFQFDDVEQLAKILFELTNNSELIEKLRANSFITFKFEDYINHLKYLYLRTIENTLLPLEIQYLFKDKLNIEFENMYDSEETEYPTPENNYTQSTNSPMNRVSFEQNFAGGFSNKQATGKMPNPLPSPLLLNLGCGNDIRDGFVNIDLFSENPNVVNMDIRKLELPNHTVDTILASDVLEHFSHRETDSILKEWNRVLKEGAEIIIRCPNLRLQLEAYMRGDWDADVASYMIFGGQTNPGDYHSIGFDKESIYKHLNNCGFEITSYEEHDFPQNRGFINLNMTVKARKKKSNVFELDNNNFKSEDNNQVKNEIKQDINNDFKSEVKAKNNLNPQLNIVWEGSQFIYHSLALINREISYNVINSGLANLTILPFEEDTFSAKGNPKYELLNNYHIDNKEEEGDFSELPYVWVRHQWPPQNYKPEGAKWIIMQPWEYTTLRKDVYDVLKNADEIWTPSNFSRQAMINSGLDFDKVQVIPNGINPEIFKPDGINYNLKTNAKIKFLFVGGTLSRKGIDILLKTFVKTFTKNDPVSLVIKDIGGDSFYKGQNAQELIQTLQKNPDAPEFIYISEDLTEEEMASLYRACDVFVSPYRGEGFCLPALEAMACGLPVIVTEGGATDDFVDNSFAWRISAKDKLLENNNPLHATINESYYLEPDDEALIYFFTDILNNPNVIKYYGYIATYKARKFWTWERATLKMYNRLDALYNTTMAKEYAKQITDISDDYMLIGEAISEIENGDYDKAIEILNSITNSDFTDTCIILNSIIYLNKGKYNQAKETINKIDSNKYQVEFNYITSICYLAENKLVEALEHINPIISNWHNLKWTCKIEIRLDDLINIVADTLYLMEDYENAIEIYKSSVNHNPMNTSAVLGVAKCMFELGNKEEAIALIQDIKNEFPNEPTIDEILDSMMVS